MQYQICKKYAQICIEKYAIEMHYKPKICIICILYADICVICLNLDEGKYAKFSRNMYEICSNMPYKICRNMHK